VVFHDLGRQAVVNEAHGGGAVLGKLVRTMRFADLDQLEAGRADLEAAIRAWCDWKAASAERG
jgi:hypothetical protein